MSCEREIVAVAAGWHYGQTDTTAIPAWSPASMWYSSVPKALRTGVAEAQSEDALREILMKYNILISLLQREAQDFLKKGRRRKRHGEVIHFPRGPAGPGREAC